MLDTSNATATSGTNEGAVRDAQQTENAEPQAAKALTERDRVEQELRQLAYRRVVHPACRRINPIGNFRFTLHLDSASLKHGDLTVYAFTGCRRYRVARFSFARSPQGWDLYESTD